LHCLPDPIPGDDLHYKSFEELYGKQTTEDHRPSLKNVKTRAKSKIKITKIKHTMPFCPTAARAKNVGITVNCVECGKPRLLFSVKKLSEKDKTILQGFLDTIFYTCGTSFHDTCDLAMAIPPKQTVIHDDTENNDGEANDQENVEEDKENEQNEPDDLDNVDEDSIERNYDNMDDSIRELFLRVFVNDSWSCESQVEKPYYSAGIYPDVCIECGNSEVTRAEKGEHPHCTDCSSNNVISKKRLKWKQGGKDKGKQKA